MIRMFVRHNVKDYGAWRKVYDEFDAERRQMGVTSHAVFQAIDNPNDVTLWHDFDTPGKAMEFAESDKFRDAMQKAGIDGQPQIWFAMKT
jgi:hypothetical protein